MSSTASEKTRTDLKAELRELRAKLSAKDDVIAMLLGGGSPGELEMESLSEEEEKALRELEEKIEKVEEAYVEVHLSDPYAQAEFWETFPWDEDGKMKEEGEDAGS